MKRVSLITHFFILSILISGCASLKGSRNSAEELSDEEASEEALEIQEYEKEITKDELVQELEMDLERDGELVKILTCDKDVTQFKEYKEKDNEGGVGPSLVMTIAIKNVLRYYVFSPNPNSMSPITFSYAKNFNGKFRKISEGDRDANLSREAPNLFASGQFQDNDCKDQTILKSKQ